MTTPVTTTSLQELRSVTTDNQDTQTLAFAVASMQKSHNDDAAERLQRNRERNREHARRTRLRKKAQLQSLQARCSELKEEQEILRQKVEERNIASILLGLGSSIVDTVVVGRESRVCVATGAYADELESDGRDNACTADSDRRPPG